MMPLKTIDKSIFDTVIKVLALSIPSQKCQQFRSLLTKYLLAKPRLSSIIADENDSSRRYMVLNELITDKSLSQLPPSIATRIREDSTVSVVDYDIKVDYNYYTAQEVLSRLLPAGMEPPTAYEQVGHLIHLNLRDDVLPYKYIIGQVLLDKVPTCKTVVNKVGKIDSVFRTFDMEVIAGEDNTVVSLKEENCIFTFDYRKVYWNSRLQHEHARLVHTFQKEDRIADMFCGIGPFVLPAAKRGCHVYGNDLNPECYRYLNENLVANNLQQHVQTFNLDARDFITRITQENLPITQIVMNLPVSAELFCDVFRSCFTNYTHPLPKVHCYMFSSEEDAIADSVKRVEIVLKAKLADGLYEGRLVRDVAPKKMMTLISFQLTEDMIDRPKKRPEEAKEAKGMEEKRIKLD